MLLTSLIENIMLNERTVELLLRLQNAMTMNLLRDKSPNIQFEAFHVFKVNSTLQK